MPKKIHKVGDLVACKVGTEYKYRFVVGTVVKINQYAGKSYQIQWSDKPDRPSICSEETLEALKKLLTDIMSGNETETADIYIGDGA